MPLAKIVYASMTGNTEACADIVADKLEELGFEVELDECSSVDADEMADAFYDDFCICVDMFEAQFEKTGATKGAELVRVDLSPEDEDEAHLEAFAETLAAHFN